MRQILGGNSTAVVGYADLRINLVVLCGDFNRTAALCVLNTVLDNICNRLANPFIITGKGYLAVAVGTYINIFLSRQVQMYAEYIR